MQFKIIMKTMLLIGTDYVVHLFLLFLNMFLNNEKQQHGTNDKYIFVHYEAMKTVIS